MIHASHLTYGYLEHCGLQHCIVVYFKPEPHPPNKVGNLVEAERVSFADITIIPAHTNQMTRWTRLPFPREMSVWSSMESEVSEAIILSIEPDLLNRIAKDKIEASSIELQSAIAQSDILIKSIALNIKVELESQTSDRVYVESLFQALLMHLIKNYCTKEYSPTQVTAGLPPYRLKQAIDYIDRHLDTNIKIKDVAKSIGISQYYFCRLFRQSTGITPYRYVIQQRILKAKALIGENQLSLLDIAIECGFSSQSQMTNHFRKLVGTTPKIYRNRLF